MSATLSWNYTDTSITSVGTIQPASLSFDTDFAKKEASDANSCIITNVTSPYDRPETIRYAISRISNIYSGSGLEAGYQAPNRAGTSLLIQDVTILTSEDAATGIRVDYPFSAHLVLKIPYSAVVTDAVLNTVLARLLGACFEKSGSTPGPRLSKLIRGALIPSAMV